MHRYRIYLITGITLTSIYMYVYIYLCVRVVFFYLYISCILLMGFRGLDNGLSKNQQLLRTNWGTGGKIC